LRIDPAAWAAYVDRDPNTSALAVVWICECVARMAQVLAEKPEGARWLFG
jgi:hypothetical protein